MPPTTPLATATRARSPLAAARTIWLTGLPSAGKTTLATALVERLRAAGEPAEHLDGDVLRAELGADLGFSRADREENVRRIGVVADLLSRNGVHAVCSVISPYRSSRDALRERIGDRFLEVWVSTPVEVCAQRDVKGLYARHARGEIANLTGVDDPYEAPLAPEVVVPTHRLTLDDAVDVIWTALSA